VRLVNMRGVNLDVFDFDYDLTWAAFLMNADEKIYGRFGGRDPGSADRYLTLAGLKYSLRAALTAHLQEPTAKPAETKKSRTVEQYAAAGRLKANACIHCHQVYDFRREAMKAAKSWRQEEIWVYPLPANVGLAVDENQGNRVVSVTRESVASRAGLRHGDILQRVDNQPVASFADLEYALHRAPAQGTIALSWQRDGKALTGSLELADGWRETDISWRTSMWGLEPVPGVHGKDLTAEEKKALGLASRRLAFRQGQFVPPQARAAGVQAQDIILGIDQKPLEMTMLQFNAYIRLNHEVGDRIILNVLRNGQRLDLPMTLAGRGN
jgi:predicted metalloprotease with PDZ domain